MKFIYPISILTAYRVHVLSALFLMACTQWSLAESAKLPAEHPELNASQNTVSEDPWEALFKERMGWWSLQALDVVSVPTVNNSEWVKTPVDSFILSALEAKGLAPVDEASPRTLARRLSFALTGLPPSPEMVNPFAANPSSEAYEAYVHYLLDNPHFGERWARHWMDVVHYSDTHGYEWDTPAKNAWMYRDYLIRAYNEDVSYRQLVLEQIAGDLIEPRINTELNLNESIIGPMSMRLGERRHGDNSQTEGVTQEAVANIIDTVSKGYLATTVACAQCHDHKLDAVAQKDYYSLAGVVMSSRWGVRMATAHDPNVAVIAELDRIKQELRREVATQWMSEGGTVISTLLAALQDQAEAKSDESEAKESPFPETLPAIWEYVIAKASEEGNSIEATWKALSETYRAVRVQRVAQNKHPVKVIADFTQEDIPVGWRIDGYGMKYGLVEDGALVIADEGDTVITQVLPAGRWSHVWSKRLGGAVRSPRFAQDPTPTISVEYAGGDYAALSMNVDNAFHTERMKFLNQPNLGWFTSKAGNLEALAGGPDTIPRQVYLEFVTKSLNNYYPPRDAYGGLSQAVENDPRSWFGLTRVLETTEGQAPVDMLDRFEALFVEAEIPTTAEALAQRLSAVLMEAVDTWRNEECTGDDVRLLNEALEAHWLANTQVSNMSIASLLEEYRATERKLQPATVVGSVDDWNEGIDIPIGVRGSYTEFGDAIPRGTIRFLEALDSPRETDSSRRLELAQNFAHEDNPLVARVYVNRVWHHLFGSGLVRTVDDFGHLGEKPSHPELLDWLAQWFMDEGWSTKKLVNLLVTSATWRQSSIAHEQAVLQDPENRLWHHIPMRRLEAEAIRDSMLAVSGRLEPVLYGEPINPYRVAEDKTKRLYAGPLDGNGRRTVYQKMTLMDPPKFTGLFNQPIPKLTTGRRDTTNVPNQALALLNNPFGVAMAEYWSQALVHDGVTALDERIETMFEAAFASPAEADDIARIVAFAEECAVLRGVSSEDLLSSQLVWQDVAHALFNLKEFIYVQ